MRESKLASNDPSLTVSRLRLRRVIAGVYEHVNRPTGTTWRISRRTVSGPGEYATWVFYNAGDNREGGNDVYYSKAEAVEALVSYLQGRFRHPSFGWCTR